MSIETNFVPYQIALDMKLLGFDEECLAYYDQWVKNNNEIKQIFRLGNVKGIFDSITPAPTFSQSFKFFRDKYNLYYSINPLGYNMCLGSVGELGSLKSVNADVNAPYGNYQEAELACLAKLIEIVKKNK
jgi:hypothetical protein